VERFRIEDLGKSSPVFDMAKLTWLNGVYMRELLSRDPQRVVEACVEPLSRAGLLDGRLTPALEEYVRKVVEVLGERIKTGSDILVYGDFFFTPQVSYEPAAAERYLKAADVADLLAGLRDRVAAASAFGVADAEAVLRGYAADRGVAAREIVHPTRVALTGKTAGPGLFELMALLGRERVTARLDAAVQYVRSSSGASSVGPASTGLSSS
jgi:glutamyl/glutaminyl-tRNA synthetase